MSVYEAVVPFAALRDFAAHLLEGKARRPSPLVERAAVGGA